MTDEDDDNDRMERADRIRRMREGRRSRGRTDGAGEAEATEEPASADDDETDADESAADDAPEPTAEVGGEPTDAGNGSEPTVDGTTDPEPAADESEAAEASAGAATDIGESEPDEPAGDAGGFEFEGSNGDGETDDAAEDASDLAVETAADAEALEEKVAALSETQRGVAESVTSGDAERAVAGLGRSTFAIPDQATTVSEDDDALDVEGTVAAARAAAATGRRTAATADRTRVLEFELGDERFCLDIDYIEEIVELENMTRVPNSPSYVEGVVDLRGQVTAIINPKDALDVGDEGRGDLIIVFDSEQMDEQGHLGWVVDEVRQVTPVSEDEVNESPDEDAEHINGVINREDEDDFVVWTTPDLALNSS
jgi:purine-binding chemotaxis protein CheW